MKLTRLRLLGFKSFVEPTDFLIEPGLTGVVGPNGCGKSNLVEALRWVMGETSHKSLRAADMDDVIFSGTNGRPSRNNAEVAMHDRQHAPARRRRSSTSTSSSTSRAGSSATRARPIASTAARCAPATSTSCSPTPRPARARPRWCTRAASARSSRPSPSSAGACWKKPPAFPACMRAATRRSCGCARPSRTSRASRTSSTSSPARSTRSRSRRARRSATATSRRRCAPPRRRCSICAGSAPMPSWRRPSRAATSPSASSASAPASRRRPPPARPRRRPPCRRCARPRPGPPPALQRLVIARETLEQEETRAKNRMAELDQRLVQLAADIERERRQAADAEAALARFVAEEETLNREGGANAEKRTDADRRVAEADAVLAAAEKTFAELTGTLADLTARRNQLQARDRFPERARAAPRRGAFRRRGRAAQLGASTAGRPDLVALSQAADTAQAAVDGGRGRRGARRGGAFRRAAGARRGARPARRGRAPRAAARHRGQDAGQAPARRHQEPLAGGDRRHHRHQGLRGRARRRARRRSRSAGRSLLADALGRRRDRAGRSAAAGRRRAARASTSQAPKRTGAPHRRRSA